MGFDPLDFARDNAFKPLSQVAGEAFKSLSRPSGAVLGALEGSNPRQSLRNLVTGWQHPERFTGENVGFVRYLPENSKQRKIGAVAAQIATDPLNVVTAGAGGAIGSGLRKAPALGKLAPFIEPIAPRGSSFGRKLATEYGVNIAARGAAAGVQASPLPDVVKTPLSLAAGFAVGGLTARGLTRGAVIANVLEEQLEEGPSYLDYLETLKPKFKLTNKTTGEVLEFDTALDAGRKLRELDNLKLTKGAFDYSVEDTLANEIRRSGNPDYDISIRIGDEEIIDRAHLFYASKAVDGDDIKDLKAQYDVDYNHLNDYNFTPEERTALGIVGQWVSPDS